MKNLGTPSFISLVALIGLMGCAPTDNLVGTTTAGGGGTTGHSTAGGAAQGGTVPTTSASATTGNVSAGGKIVTGGAGGTTNSASGGMTTTVATAGASGQAGVVLPTDPEVCVLATVNIEYGGGMSVSYERGVFDPTTLVVEWRGTAAPDFTAVTSRRYARYDPQGRELMHGDANTGYDLFRWDYSYNEHGDRLEASLSYPTTFNVLDKPSEPYHMREQYSHEYDASGRLASTTCTALNNGWSHFVRQSYVTDALGNCTEIRVDAAGDGSVSYIERRGYDSLHRLIRSEVMPSDGVTWPPHNVITYIYDDQGRMLQRAQDGGGHWAATPDGIPDLIATWTYAADGTTNYDSWDFTTDTPNETIDRDGRQVSVGHYRTIRSAGCAKIDAQIGTPPVTGACRF